MILQSTTVGQTHSSRVWSGLSLQKLHLNYQTGACTGPAGLAGGVQHQCWQVQVQYDKNWCHYVGPGKNRRVAKYDGFVFVGVL